ncbi:hypothetical protein FOZ62_016547, partial [Perkinsus olseni]
QLGPNRVVPPVTVRELEQVVSRFRDGSPGEDHINNDILKQTLSDLKDVWAHTFTTLLNERVHPEEFKRGRGLLLLKPHRDPAKVSCRIGSTTRSPPRYTAPKYLGLFAPSPVIKRFIASAATTAQGCSGV